MNSLTNLSLISILLLCLKFSTISSATETLDSGTFKQIPFDNFRQHITKQYCEFDKYFKLLIKQAKDDTFQQLQPT